jgi:N-acetylglucosaminyldiphosphoundecaprenol N-acetyl-beta-D-mannosaminyltransferase
MGETKQGLRTETTGRVFDVVLAAGATLALLPAALAARLGGARLHLRRTERLGLDARPFVERALDVSGRGRSAAFARAVGVPRLPTLWNVLRGDMGIVGPRPLAPEEAEALAGGGASDGALRRRHSVRPGLVSLHWIRRRGNVAYASELADDLEYASAPGVRRRLGILARAGLVLAQGRAAAQAPPFLRILGVRVHNLTMAGTVERIVGWLNGGAPRQVAFVNADCINRCRGDAEYRGVLNMAHLTLADGSGVRLAGRILRQPIRENVNGTDLFPQLCGALEGTPHGVFLLGGRPGVAEGVSDWIRRHHPAVRIAGLRHGFFSPEEEPAVADQIRASGASLLLVALGAPRQDVWIRRHLAASGARVAIGVGGLFDFYSGRIPRAPMWMRELGLEWVYRFWQEPGRMWKRYWVGNFAFLARVVTEIVARQDGVFVPGPIDQEVNP